jgi:hypothetical protein
MSAFVKEIINNCLDQLTDDSADKIVTRMLTEASLSSTSSEASGVATAMPTDGRAQADTDSMHELNTFIQNALNKSLDDSDDDTASSNSYLEGDLSETVIESFILDVLSGSAGDMSSVDKLKKVPVRKTSLTELVKNRFMRSIIDCAMNECKKANESHKSAVIGTYHDSSQIISIYIKEILNKSKRLTSQKPSELVLSSLAKEVSCSLVEHVEKKKSNEIQDYDAPRKGSSMDLLNHSHESHSGVFTDESSDEEEKLQSAEPLEVEITPVLRSQVIDINPQEIAPALSAISMRASLPGHLAHRFEATGRNSFASLIHPDLSRVRGLKKDSAGDIKRKLHQAFMQSVMQVSKETVIVSDDVHEPGEVSESSSSEEDNDEDDEIKAIDGCPTATAKRDDRKEPNKETSSLRAISPAISKSSKSSKLGGAKSTSQTRTTARQANNSCSRNVTQSGSDNVKGKSSSSDNVGASFSSPKGKVSGSGSIKDSSPARHGSGSSQSSLRRPSSQVPVGASSSGKQVVHAAASNPSTKTKSKPEQSVGQNQLTPKSRKTSTTSTKSAGSVSKVKPVRSKASSSSGRAADMSSSNETRKANSDECSPSKKSSTASPARYGSKMTASKTTNTPPGGSAVESRSGGQAGPAETGSISDLRAEKEMKKARSGQNTSGVQASSSANVTSPRQQTSGSKPLSRRSSEGQATIATISGNLISDKKTPSNSVITPDEPSDGADVPRILSEGDIVKVRSLYGSFSSTLKVRSSTDVQKSESSGTKIATKSSSHRPTAKTSGSGH